MFRINDEYLGELIYNSDLMWFEGKIKWLGKEIEISVNTDDNDEEDCNEMIELASDMVKNQAKWDKTIRKFAAKKLIKIANEWAEGSNSHKITKEQFADRIHPNNISFFLGGGFIFWFNDDDMFRGRSVVVYGDVIKGCTEAEVAV